jgi:NhaA family Na+:H+ antiporter
MRKLTASILLACFRAPRAAFRRCYGCRRKVNVVFRAGNPDPPDSLGWRGENRQIGTLGSDSAHGLGHGGARARAVPDRGRDHRDPGRPRPIEIVHVDLTAGQWISDGLLAIFFLLAAIELRHELTRGELASPRKAIVPVVAALGGVVAPAAIFLLLVRDPALASGWPVPTATDVAFALGALAILGRGLPSRIRALLLALAIVDDLIAIAIIAMFFTTDLEPLPALGAAVVVLVVGWLSHRVRDAGPRTRIVVTAVCVLLALATWLFVLWSGIHPTIAGVALGLALPPGPARRVRRVLEPVSNTVVLPLFAFSAALVVIPSIPLLALGPVFWAILVALPIGKLIGIAIGGLLAQGRRRDQARAVPVLDLLVVAGLGGIGFTVSLLMSALAYERMQEVLVEATLGVLAGSLVSIVLGGAITAGRAAHYRRVARLSPGSPR